MKMVHSVKECREVYKEEPHMAPEVIEFMDKFLTKGKIVFEWGAGGSTIWMARRAGKVYSVEDKDFWNTFLQEKIKEVCIANITLLYRPTDQSEPGDEYCKAIEEFETRFDIIIVDGLVHARNKCLEIALTNIAPGGRIIFDDYESPRFDESRKILRTWNTISCKKYDNKRTAMIYKNE